MLSCKKSGYVAGLVAWFRRLSRAPSYRSDQPRGGGTITAKGSCVWPAGSGRQQTAIRRCELVRVALALGRAGQRSAGRYALSHPSAPEVADWWLASYIWQVLVNKSTDGRGSCFPGHTHPTTSVTTVPSAVEPFRTAIRICNLTVEVPRHDALIQQFCFADRKRRLCPIELAYF